MNPYGTDFTREAQLYGIRAFVDGDDTLTSDAKDTLAEALLDALETEVDKLLPDGSAWYPNSGRFDDPDDGDLPDSEEMTELFSEAWQAVEARLADIEAATLGAIPADRDLLSRQIEAIPDPVHRARVAGMLADSATTAMCARLRAAAIHEATRGALTYAQVAERLGVSESAINKAVAAHNRTASQ